MWGKSILNILLVKSPHFRYLNHEVSLVKVNLNLQELIFLP